MKKKSLKLIVSTLLITMISLGIIGCGKKSNVDNDINLSEGVLSGTLTISGSSALLPLMEQSIEKFNEKYPEVEISAQAGGSGTGLAQVLEGNVDIGNSDVLAKEKLPDDKSDVLVDHKVIAQGFGIVVSKKLGIKDLTKNQIKGIFSGKITNWSEVGGPNTQIFIVHRKSGSGTRATFENTILDGDASLVNESIGVMQDSNGAVLSAMKANEGAISYVSLAYMNNQEAKEVLDVVSIDNVKPDKVNICNGSYPFWSYGHMYTKGEATSPAREFIEFVSSKENSESLDNLGFIPGPQMEVK